MGSIDCSLPHAEPNTLRRGLLWSLRGSERKQGPVRRSIRYVKLRTAAA